ncbi:MAG: hypothetical protein J6V03_06915 [Clostridia bacterium]|nr:hypothetical protein [Clostridia bacterium]
MENLKLELTMFDGEATAAIADAAPQNTEAADAQPQEAKILAPNDLADQKNAEFEKLIKGEYRDQFEQRIKDNLKRRFKESSSLKQRISQSDEIINMLKIKYGINENGLEGLADAIKNDNGFLKEEAQRQGIEPDILQKLRTLEFENESMKRQIEDGLEERKLRQTVDSWIEDSKELSQTYPDFDLELEAQNPRFYNLLKSGLDLKSAYYATHHEDIVKKMMEKASEEASVKITDSIRARGTRPNENGLSGRSTAIIKTDVSKLTPKERAEIAKRVMRGEEISF